MGAQHSRFVLFCYATRAGARICAGFVPGSRFDDNRGEYVARRTSSRQWIAEPEVQVSQNIQYVSDGEFDQKVLKSEIPVLVDFWAEWCGPCKMIAPVLEQIAGEYAGRLTVAKLNIDDNPGTPPKYGIRGIPTLMLFKDGNVEATKVGAVSKSQLSAFIDSNI
jgi:thioredoxin 1